MGVISQADYQRLAADVAKGGAAAKAALAQLTGNTVAPANSPGSPLVTPSKASGGGSSSSSGGSSPTYGIQTPQKYDPNWQTTKQDTSTWLGRNDPVVWGTQAPQTTGGIAARGSLGQFMDAQIANLNNMYNSNQESGIAKLRAARDTALAGYATQGQLAEQQAQKNRDATDVSAAQASQKLREAMANAGLLGSGDNASAMIQLQNQRQNAFNDIGTNLSNTLDQITANKNALNSSSAQQEAALINDIAAQKAQALQQLNQFGYGQMQTLDNQTYQRSQDALKNAMLQRQQEIDNSFRQNQADVTNKLNEWNKNVDLAKWASEYTGSIVQPKNDAQLVFDQISNKVPLSTQQLTAQLTGKLANGQLTYQAIRDMVKDQQYQQQFEADQAKYGMDYALRKAAQMGQLDLQKAQLQLAQDKFAWDKSPDNPANSPKPKSSPVNLDDYKTYINNNFYTEQTDNNGDKKKVFDPNGAEQYILNLYNNGMIDANGAKSLYTLFRIPTK